MMRKAKVMRVYCTISFVVGQTHFFISDATSPGKAATPLNEKLVERPSDRRILAGTSNHTRIARDFPGGRSPSVWM